MLPDECGCYQHHGKVHRHRRLKVEPLEVCGGVADNDNEDRKVVNSSLVSRRLNRIFAIGLYHLLSLPSNISTLHLINRLPAIPCKVASLVM